MLSALRHPLLDQVNRDGRAGAAVAPALHADRDELRLDGQPLRRLDQEERHEAGHGDGVAAVGQRGDLRNRDDAVAVARVLVVADVRAPVGVAVPAILLAWVIS